MPLLKTFGAFTVRPKIIKLEEVLSSVYAVVAIIDWTVQKRTCRYITRPRVHSNKTKQVNFVEELFCLWYLACLTAL